MKKMLTLALSRRFRVIRALMLFSVVFGSIKPCASQLYIGPDVNSLVIKSGDSFSYEGLTLIPATNFTLNDNTLTRTDAKSISPTPTGDYIARYFSFSKTTAVFSGTIRFSYAGATLSPLTAGLLELNIRKDSTTWTNKSGTDNGSSYVEATVSGAHTLNTLTLASIGVPLPVTWLYFSASLRNNAVDLNWATAAEFNTQHFLVQHSSSGVNWQTLELVEAAGNSATPRYYSCAHTNPSFGNNYYRLIQQDLDGKQYYSDIVRAWVGENGRSIRVYPNPVPHGELTVCLIEDAVCRIFDATGRNVLSLPFRAGIHKLDVSGLQRGLYHLHCSAEVFPIIIP
jgi:hypothetical protein